MPGAKEARPWHVRWLLSSCRIKIRGLKGSPMKPHIVCIIGGDCGGMPGEGSEAVQACRRIDDKSPSPYSLKYQRTPNNQDRGWRSRLEIATARPQDSTVTPPGPIRSLASLCCPAGEGLDRKCKVSLILPSGSLLLGKERHLRTVLFWNYRVDSMLLSSTDGGPARLRIEVSSWMRGWG